MHRKNITFNIIKISIRRKNCFFSKSQTDSALFYYDKVFESFEFGLKLEHLKKYPLFLKALPQILKDKKLKATYDEKKKTYLSKNDFDCLDQIYKMAIQDQKMKSQNNYEINILKTTDKLKNLTLKRISRRTINRCL